MLQAQPVVLKEAVQVLNLALQGAQTPKSFLVPLLGLNASHAVELLNLRQAGQCPKPCPIAIIKARHSSLGCEVLNPAENSLYGTLAYTPKSWQPA